MKGFAIVLLCALVAVQGRNTGVQLSSRAAASLGENPWVVHLRVAVSTSGLLNSYVGSLIDNRWVLTTASAVANQRFIWLRYGVVNVINPSEVTESSQVRIHPDNKIALINIGRAVQSTDNIALVALTSDGDIEGIATFSAFGALESGEPGEQLSSYEVSVSKDGDSLVVSSDELETTKFDVGAPLVKDGVQIGILLEAASEDSTGTFISTADYLDWIQSETGINFDPEVAPEAVRFMD